MGIILLGEHGSGFVSSHDVCCSLTVVEQDIKLMYKRVSHMCAA